MTKAKNWSNFEEKIRDIAKKIWAVDCQPARIGGVDIDSVSKIDAEIWCLVEITVERNLNKVRDDIIKLKTAKAALYEKGILARCFCVINGNVTTAMREAGEPHKIRVFSAQEFTRQFFRFDTYRAIRSGRPFGSAVDPISGEPDQTKYVPVRYLAEGKKADINASEVADLLRDGRDVVLLGEYGSGKSRRIREIFEILSEKAEEKGYFPLAIDLRRSWGLTSAVELIRRHFIDLGLEDMASSAVRAFNEKTLIVLIDGFDEIGSQAWSADVNKIKAIRAKALEGVRNLVQSNGGGAMIAGREHYFTSSNEMYSALGLRQQNTSQLRLKDEFSDSELLDYFNARDLDVTVPRWLPRRPLICQTISQLAETDIERMFGDHGNEVEFWDHFIKVLCERDAATHISFDADTIYRIFILLARYTRTKPADVGPLTLTELQSAFETVTGFAPVEEASVMLQRLPSLGRIGVESNDRQFVDTYILDGLRAHDISMIALDSNARTNVALGERWMNPLGDLGQKVLAQDRNTSTATKISIAVEAQQQGNVVLACDVIAALARLHSDAVDFGGLSIAQGKFSLLALNERPIKNLTLTDSYFTEIVMPALQCSGVTISGGVAERVTGISSSAAYPSWLCVDAEAFDEVGNVAQIRRIGLSPSHEILVTIIRKTFFQKGSGRKEEALLRGLGQLASKRVSDRVIKLLISEGLLTTFKGNEGAVYSPVRGHTPRMQKLLNELEGSSDPLWALTRELT